MYKCVQELKGPPLKSHFRHTCRLLHSCLSFQQLTGGTCCLWKSMRRLVCCCVLWAMHVITHSNVMYMAGCVQSPYCIEDHCIFMFKHGTENDIIIWNSQC